MISKLCINIPVVESFLMVLSRLGDLESWKDEEHKSQPMKASAFASEDPAPYTHLTITGITWTFTTSQ